MRCCITVYTHIILILYRPHRNSSDAPRLFDTVALGERVLVPLPHRSIVLWGALLVGKEKDALSERGEGGDQGRGVWWERFQRAYTSHELMSHLAMLPVQPLGCQRRDVGVPLIDRLPSMSPTESMRCMPHRFFSLSLVHHCDPGKKIDKFGDMAAYCARVFSCCRLLQSGPHHTDGVETVPASIPSHPMSNDLNLDQIIFLQCGFEYLHITATVF